MAKYTKVRDVIRDRDGSAIWVRVGYFEEVIEERPSGPLLLRHLLHDAIFMPKPGGWVWKFKDITKNFIPRKRYQKMAKMADNIIKNRTPKDPKQQQFLF